MILKRFQIPNFTRQNPQKILAILSFSLALLLFLGEIIINLDSFKQPPINIKPPALIKTEANLLTNSPLFTKALFGIYTQGLDNKEIKPSLLNLKVVGILFSQNKESSQVIIQASKGEEKNYTVGDSLPGGAIIKSISPQRVVILYNGRLEHLSLSKNRLILEPIPLELKFYAR